jgi:hypothetical protein
MKKLGLLLSAIIAAAISSAAQTPADTTAVMEAITQPIHPNGYMGEASIEVLATGAYHSADIGITTTHGVMFKDRYFFGGGAGYLRDFNANQYLIPIYIDGRIFFKSAGNKRIYPHVGLRLGGALVSEGSSGFYGALSGGVRVPIGRHLGLSINIGPHLITKYERPSYGKAFHANGYKIGFFGRVSMDF